MFFVCRLSKKNILLNIKLLLSPFDFLFHFLFEKTLLQFFNHTLNFQSFLCYPPETSLKQVDFLQISVILTNFIFCELFFRRGTYFEQKIKNYHLISSKIKTGSCNQPLFLYSHALRIACGIQLSLISAAGHVLYQVISLFCALFLNKQVLMFKKIMFLKFFVWPFCSSNCW